MNNERQFQGIWIPAEIWLDKELSVMEKLFLVEIQSLDDPEKGCWASNAYFSSFFDISKTRCSQIIKGLEKKGLLEVIVNRQGKQIVSRQIKVCRKLHRVCRKLNNPMKNIKQPYEENCKENNTPFNNTKSSKGGAKEKKEKIEILTFGEKVKLPLPAYEKLITEFGELKIVEYIEKINTYLTTTENGLKKGEYKNYAMTIRNWIASDGNGNSANHSPQQAHAVASWKEKAAYLSNGRKDSDWWAQSGEDNQTWAKRVVTWLKVGLDKHWDIERQDWRMDTEAQETMVKKLYFHARDILQGKAV